MYLRKIIYIKNYIFVYFYVKKMVIFEIIVMRKSDPNIHKNAPNCNIKKKLSGEHAPESA